MIEPDTPPREFTFGAGAQLLDWGIHQVMQRKFVGLLQGAKDAQLRYQMDEDDFLGLLRFQDAPPEAAFALLFAQLTADALEQLSSHVLTGTAFDPFLNTSGDLREISLAIGDQSSLLKTDVLTAIGRRLSKTSVWNELSSQIARDGLWRRMPCYPPAAGERARLKPEAEPNYGSLKSGRCVQVYCRKATRA